MGKQSRSLPVIGVIPLYDSKKESLWMLPGYFDGIREAGGVPVMLPLETSEEALWELCGKCDGVLFTGGQDVDPALYFDTPGPCCGEICRARDAMETVVFRKAFNTDLPMFGICRGIQLINVLMGGTLYQDLPSEYDGGVSVNHAMRPPYDREAHTVSIVEGTPLSDLLRREEIGVNSYHHQAVRRLAPGLTAMAYSPDGLVEAAVCKDRKFLWAVQWHPEFNFNVEPTSAMLFKEFVANCSAG